MSDDNMNGYKYASVMEKKWVHGGEEVTVTRGDDADAMRAMAMVCSSSVCKDMREGLLVSARIGFYGDLDVLGEWKNRFGGDRWYFRGGLCTSAVFAERPGVVSVGLTFNPERTVYDVIAEDPDDPDYQRVKQLYAKVYGSGNEEG